MKFNPQRKPETIETEQLNFRVPKDLQKRFVEIRAKADKAGFLFNETTVEALTDYADSWDDLLKGKRIKAADFTIPTSNGQS